MTRVATIILLLASLKLALPDGDLTSRLTEIMGDDCKLRETEHFTIAYDTSTETLSALTARLEATYKSVQLYCEGLGIAVQAPKDRLGVLFFDDYGDYSTYCSKHSVLSAAAAGFYDQQSNLSSFVNTLNTPQLKGVNEEIERLQRILNGSKNDPLQPSGPGTSREALRRNLFALGNQRDSIVRQFNRVVIQHETAHQSLFNFGVHVMGAENPVWLIEGMACLFEVPQVRSRQGAGRTNHLRLADLRDALEVEADVRAITDDGFAQAVESGRIVQPTRLISDPDLFEREGVDLIAAYAQAWALVFYLNRTQREPFADYLAEVGKQKPGVPVTAQHEIELFGKHFGQPDGVFHRSWIDYMVKLRFDRREGGK